MANAEDGVRSGATARANGAGAGDAGDRERRMARGARTAAAFAAIAKTFRVVSKGDGAAQLIAFGVLYQTGLRSMRQEMERDGCERTIAGYGCTPEELEREVALVTEKVHAAADDGDAAAAKQAR